MKAKQIKTTESDSDKWSLSVVIPAFNEAENLESLIAELALLLECQSAIREHEIIVVDDHSQDGTFEVIQRLGRQDPSVVGVRLSRRSGSHTALRAGIARSRGDVTLCLAADGQDDPHVLARMLEKIREGAHIVWAVRNGRNESLPNRLLAGAAYGVIRLFINEGAVPEGNLANADFFMFSRKVTEALNRCQERNTSLFGLLLWLGFSQSMVYYDRRERKSGRSKWSWRAKFRLFRDWIIAFSGVPLKIITALGLTISVIGFAYAVFIMIYSFLGYAKPGWAETAILILVLGGLQLLMLGITGEYLWRNLDETRSRPLYFVEAETQGRRAEKEAEETCNISS